jgi:hypothetical protein
MGAFLERFTREHRSKPVTVAKTDVRDGLRIAERATPLLDLAHDRAAHRISITTDRLRREFCLGAPQKHSMRRGDDDPGPRFHLYQLVHSLRDRPASRDHVVGDEA